MIAASLGTSPDLDSPLAPVLIVAALTWAVAAIVARKERHDGHR